jgi:hypothetical protein
LIGTPFTFATTADGSQLLITLGCGEALLPSVAVFGFASDARPPFPEFSAVGEHPAASANKRMIAVNLDKI